MGASTVGATHSGQSDRDPYTVHDAAADALFTVFPDSAKQLGFGHRPLCPRKLKRHFYAVGSDPVI